MSNLSTHLLSHVSLLLLYIILKCLTVSIFPFSLTCGTFLAKSAESDSRRKVTRNSTKKPTWRSIKPSREALVSSLETIKMLSKGKKGNSLILRNLVRKRLPRLQEARKGLNRQRSTFATLKGVTRSTRALQALRRTSAGTLERNLSCVASARAPSQQTETWPSTSTACTARQLNS